jgi:hypothetical protein
MLAMDGYLHDGERREWNPEAIKLMQEANQLDGECAAILKQSVEKAREVGAKLLDAKHLIPHGLWKPFLASYFDGSYRTAAMYMQVARNWDEVVESRAADNLPNPENLAEFFRIISHKRSVQQTFGEPADTPLEKKEKGEAEETLILRDLRARFDLMLKRTFMLDDLRWMRLNAEHQPNIFGGISKLLRDAVIKSSGGDYRCDRAFVRWFADKRNMAEEWFDKWMKRADEIEAEKRDTRRRCALPSDKQEREKRRQERRKLKTTHQKRTITKQDIQISIQRGNQKAAQRKEWTDEDWEGTMLVQELSNGDDWHPLVANKMEELKIKWRDELERSEPTDPRSETDDQTTDAANDSMRCEHGNTK